MDQLNDEEVLSFESLPLEARVRLRKLPTALQRAYLSLPRDQICQHLNSPIPPEPQPTPFYKPPAPSQAETILRDGAQQSRRRDMTALSARRPTDVELEHEQEYGPLTLRAGGKEFTIPSMRGQPASFISGHGWSIHLMMMGKAHLIDLFSRYGASADASLRNMHKRDVDYLDRRCMIRVFLRNQIEFDETKTWQLIGVHDRSALVRRLQDYCIKEGWHYSVELVQAICIATLQSINDTRKRATTKRDARSQSRQAERVPLSDNPTSNTTEEQEQECEYSNRQVEDDYDFDASYGEAEIHSDCVPDSVPQVVASEALVNSRASNRLPTPDDEFSAMQTALLARTTTRRFEEEQEDDSDLEEDLALPIFSRPSLQSQQNQVPSASQATTQDISQATQQLPSASQDISQDTSQLTQADVNLELVGDHVVSNETSRTSATSKTLGHVDDEERVMVLTSNKSHIGTAQTTNLKMLHNRPIVAGHVILFWEDFKDGIAKFGTQKLPPLNPNSPAEGQFGKLFFNHLEKGEPFMWDPSRMRPVSKLQKPRQVRTWSQSSSIAPSVTSSVGDVQEPPCPTQVRQSEQVAAELRKTSLKRYGVTKTTATQKRVKKA